MSRAGRAPCRALPACLAALVLLLSLAAFAAPALADDGPQAKPAAAEADTSTVQGLEGRLLSYAPSRWALLLGRVLPILVGIGLLVRWYLVRDRIRGGLLPPPPVGRPTVAFGLTEAVLWGLLGLQLAPYLVLALLAGGGSLKSLGLEARLVAMALPEVALAVLLLMRRQRVQLMTPAERELRFGAGVPAPTTPPGWGRAFGLGMWTFCVASLMVVPAAMVAAPLLDMLGVEPETQGPVQEVVKEGPIHLPILMAAFGVLVAPFAEESIFRGMLYPAVKRAMGGGRRGTWGAAILVSLVFAAVHQSWYALLPLFALALVLNLVFEATNSLAAVVFAHAIHNGLTMVPLLLLRFSAHGGAS